MKPTSPELLYDRWCKAEAVLTGADGKVTRQSRLPSDRWHRPWSPYHVYAVAKLSLGLINICAQISIPCETIDLVWVRFLASSVSWVNLRAYWERTFHLETSNALWILRYQQNEIHPQHFVRTIIKSEILIHFHLLTQI